MPILLLFVLFMTLGSARYVVVNTATSKVPSLQERAGFMSLMSACQHLGSSTAAFASSMILVEKTDGSLARMPQLGFISIAVTLSVPVLIYLLERHLTGRTKDPVIEHELDLTAFE